MHWDWPLGLVLASRSCPWSLDLCWNRAVWALGYGTDAWLLGERDASRCLAIGVHLHLQIAVVLLPLSSLQQGSPWRVGYARRKLQYNHWRKLWPLPKKMHQWESLSFFHIHHSFISQCTFPVNNANMLFNWTQWTSQCYGSDSSFFCI